MTANKEVIAEKILEYLEKNPDSESTLEVIADWWMKLSCIDNAVDDVADGLDYLVKAGHVKRDTTFKMTGAIYKISRDKNEDG